MFVCSSGIFCVALFLCHRGLARQICHKIRHAALPFGVADMDGLVYHAEHGALAAVVVAVNHTFSAREVNMAHSHGL